MASISTNADEKAPRELDLAADDDAFIQRATYIDGVIPEKQAATEKKKQRATVSSLSTRRFCVIFLSVGLAISLCIMVVQLYILFEVQGQDHLRFPFFSKANAEADRRLQGTGPDESDAPYQSITSEILAIATDKFEDWDYQLPEWQRETALNISQNCLLSLRESYLSDPCLALVPREQMVEALPSTNNENSLLPLQTTNRLPAAYCTAECTALASSKDVIDPRCRLPQFQTPQTKRLHDTLLQARDSRARYCLLDAPADAQCVRAVKALNLTDWILHGRPKNERLMAVIEAALATAEQEQEEEEETLLRLPPPHQRPLTGDGGGGGGGRTAALRASVCGSCFWEWWVAGGAEIVTAMSYLQRWPFEDAYVPFVKRYYETCTAMGADWLVAAEPAKMMWTTGMEMPPSVWRELLVSLEMHNGVLEAEPAALHHVLVAQAITRVFYAPGYENQRQRVQSVIASWQRHASRV